MISAGFKLRQAWLTPPLIVPGAFNALGAKMVEKLGFRACYLSGGALSAGSGVPDVGLLTLTEFVDEARRLTAATTLPVISDADTGFGETLNVERTVRLFEQVGVAGIHLEDQEMPKRCGHLSGKSLVSPEVMASKIRAAVAAKTDPHFVIIARTDARALEGIEAAIDRANRYLDAGADAIFAEAMESEAEFVRFAQGVRAPLLANMTEFGKSPLLSAQALGQLGYAMVLYPLTAFRVAMKAAENAYAQLLSEQTQVSFTNSMLTRAALYDYLDYTNYETRDRAYFGDGKK
jgi:methylisocitrate lyase